MLKLFVGNDDGREFVITSDGYLVEWIYGSAWLRPNDYSNMYITREGIDGVLLEMTIEDGETMKLAQIILSRLGVELTSKRQRWRGEYNEKYYFIGNTGDIEDSIEYNERYDEGFVE
ncbi:MAG: hypothetical protein DSY76_07215 [Bacteroidetes bacterium]|nr:MAG: hypothetical protein DSY76_07215 [Bacteroidota bacterium]